MSVLPGQGQPEQGIPALDKVGAGVEDVALGALEGHVDEVGLEGLLLVVGEVQDRRHACQSIPINME